MAATSKIPVPSMRTRRGSAALYFLFAVIITAAATYQIALVRGILHRMRVDIPEFTLQTASPEINALAPEAKNLGVKRGDILVAVNGRPYVGTAVLAQEEYKSVAGSTLAVTLRSPSTGQQNTIDLHVTPRQRDLRLNSIPILLFVIIVPICLALGSWVVLVRPRDMLAWLLLGMLLGFTQSFGESRVLEAWPNGWRELAVAYHQIVGASWPILMLLFGFYFPEPFPRSYNIFRWRMLGWLVIVPLSISAVIDTSIATGQISNWSAVAPLYHRSVPLEVLSTVLAYTAIGGFFCFLFIKSSAPALLAADARRRLRLLYWGTTVSMAPALLVSTIATLETISYDQMPLWMTYPSLLMLLLFPLTLAYVIVVQRAMDVRVVVRQSLQYGLAKTGIRVLQVSAIAVVIATAFALGSNVNTAGKIIVIAVAVTIGLSIPRGAERLRTWTDRRFFREAYNAEQVLSELSDHVRSMIETRPLIETVATRIADTLHVHNVAVLLGGTGPYHPEYALGYSVPLRVTFPAGAGTIKALQSQKEPARVYLEDQESWLYRDPQISDEDRAKLAELRAELLLPLGAQDKLLGFISLGPKRSDEPYSGADLRLLKSVAAQTGLALDNARLMSAIAEEVAQRERLNREVEIAREVQERLFPQTLPPITGIDYAGSCRPALGVGGDYYDFLALPHGQLGIAIGDVAGKGISAALMMASLQASLRSEATRAPENLASLVANVNRLIYEASAANRYATFFYAQFNPANRCLNYVNAGHNPPMLFRRENGSWQISRLQTGGTVVGLMENFPYEQGAVVLAPGDILVAFTDGISEAMNNSDDEWGEECLTQTIECCASLDPAKMIARIMQAADTFVAGAKQHDDMTLVILRVTGDIS